MPIESEEKKRAPTDLRLIVCTGERVGNIVNRLYRPEGIATTSFLPMHAKGLSNEFYCFANFECEHWNWRGAEARES